MRNQPDHTKFLCEGCAHPRRQFCSATGAVKIRLDQNLAVAYKEGVCLSSCVCGVEDGSATGARHGRSQQSGVRTLTRPDTRGYSVSVRRSRAVINQHYGRALRHNHCRHCPLTRPDRVGTPSPPRGRGLWSHNFHARKRVLRRQVRERAALRPWRKNRMPCW